MNKEQLQDKLITIYNEEAHKIFEENWSQLTESEKKFTIEFLKQIYPSKAKMINEAQWYNTFFDIVGIVDPTGIVDFGNGISYWNQGDKLFAVLSWISVFPIIGDAIAKPVMGLFKLGGAAPKAFKAAAAVGNTTKMAQIAKGNKTLGKLVTSAPSWGGKLMSAMRNMIGKVPLVGKGLVKAVDDFIKLFTTAGKEYKAGSTISRKLLAKGESNLTKLEKEQLADALKKTEKFRGFRDFGDKKSWYKYVTTEPGVLSKLSAGVPRLWGNPATRSLMRRTKWYLGLLDFVGLANFVGPEELDAEVENLEGKVAEYSQTPQSQEYLSQDLSGMESSETITTPSTSTDSEPKKSDGGLLGDVDPFSFAVKSLLGF